MGLEEAVCLRGSLGSLFTEGWGCDPTWIVVCPGASQQGWLMCGARFSQNGHLQRKAAAEHSQELCCQCPSLTTRHIHPVFPGCPPRTAVRFDPDSHGDFALPWDPVDIIVHVCLLRMGVSVYPSPVELLAHKPHWPSMPDAPGALSPRARSPHVRF